MPPRRAIPSKPRFVAGALGPTNKTLSVSPKVSDPGFRAVTFDEVKDMYREQIDGLLDGGVDFILVETVFDTLNAKAALVAADEAGEARGEILPVMVSMTLTDLAGRNLSGQTVEAFWHSVRHAKPITMGLNCSFGATELHPYVQALNPQVDSMLCVYPNAGLPNELGAYDEPPEMTAKLVKGWAENGWLNVVGGCCGTTPGHIKAIAEAVKGITPRTWHVLPPALRLSRHGSGEFLLMAQDIDVDSKPEPRATFINIGERTNVTGSAQFKKLILEGDYTAAVEVARQQVESGAQIIDINMDEGLLDAELAMDTFLKLIAAEPDIARVPIMIDSSKWSVIEAGLKCVAGKPIVNSISMKEGVEPFIEHARKVRRYGAAVVVMAFDEKGQADTKERKVEICARAYDILVNQVGFPAEDIIFDPNVFAVATGIEEHNNYGVDFIEATREIKAALPRRQDFRRRLQPLLRLPRQRAGAQGDALGVPLLCHPGRHGHGHRQCGPARGLRPDPAGAPRRLRGRDPQPQSRTPPSGCSSWRPSTRAPARSPRRRTPSGGAGRSRSGWSMRWSRAWTSSSSPTPRKRGCRSRGRSR